MVRPSQPWDIAARAKVFSSDTKEASQSTHLETEAAEFGDKSSTYWPPGWNFERFSKGSSTELIRDLPDSEIIKLQAGISEALGSAGKKRLSNYLARRRAADTEFQTSVEATIPSWLRQYMGRHRDEAWGFVAIQTTCYGNIDRWNEFKSQFRKSFEAPIDRYIDSIPNNGIAADASTAKNKLEIRWIQDPALEGETNPKVLRQLYKTMAASLPDGLSHRVFLVASQDVVDSVLEISNNHGVSEKEAASSTISTRWQPNALFIMAVTVEDDVGLEEGHDEREWFKPVFKVAIDALVDELWHVLVLDMMPVRKITRNVKGMGLDGQALGIEHTGNDLQDMWWTMAPSPMHLRKRFRIA